MRMAAPALRQRDRRVLAAGGAVLVAVVLAHAALLGRSRWQADEYLTLALMRRFGWAFLVHWYLHWSPRLWSDLLFAGYGALVERAHRPLAGSCMAALWAGLACACLLPAWAGAPRARGGRVFAGLAMLALFLVGHPVQEVFFWPAGGLSYLPTLAGAAWLFWCVADARRVAGGAALLLVSGSSEMGAFLALAVAGCLLTGGGAWWRGVWLLPGAALAVLDLALVLRGRVGTVEILDHGNLLHHTGASLLGALPLVWGQVAAGGQPDAGFWAVVVRLGTRVLVVLGARHCLVGHRRGLLGLAAALLLACYASIAASLYQFGTLCCERHDTVREAFVMLACLALGAAWPGAARAGRAAGPMLAAVLLLFAPRVAVLPREWALTRAAVAARARTWESGLRAGDRSMVFVPEPGGNVIGGVGFPPGTVRRGPGIGWAEQGLLDYFDKDTVVVLPPG